MAAWRRACEGEHHRYRSWEHCYEYFRRARPGGLAADRDRATLELAFYLASWGMYRGSSVLLDYAYTAHRGVVDVVADARFDGLWKADFGARTGDDRLVPDVLELVGAVRGAYEPLARARGSRRATDTLVTKVVLGTFGCLPACDRYFVDGFEGEGFRFSRVNEGFVRRVLGFCQGHLPALKQEQARMKEWSGVRYSLMKLVDMYFWQTGHEEGTKARSGDRNRLPAQRTR